MEFASEILQILFKMVVMVTCVIGGCFLGVKLRKSKNAKMEIENDKDLNKR